MCEATGKLIDQLSKLHVLTLWKEPMHAHTKSTQPKLENAI